MTPKELIDELEKHIPSNLATDLVDYFLQIRADLATEVLERSAPGKFIETVVQILQFLETGKFHQSPNVDPYLKNLESRPAILHDDLRITLARIARSSYTLRNKRSIAHKGGVNPNIYDLRHLYSSTQWILSEIVRHILSSDINASNKLIELIQIPVTPFVEDFGDKRLVLKAGIADEELLTLLLYYFPNYTLSSQIFKDMDRRAKSTVSNTISSNYRKRLVDGNKQQGYKLTAIGYRKASEIIKIQLLV